MISKQSLADDILIILFQCLMVNNHIHAWKTCIVTLCKSLSFCHKLGLNCHFNYSAQCLWKQHFYMISVIPFIRKTSHIIRVYIYLSVIESFAPFHQFSIFPEWYIGLFSVLFILSNLPSLFGILYQNWLRGMVGVSLNCFAFSLNSLSSYNIVIYVSVILQERSNLYIQRSWQTYAFYFI